jgi:hypothetical protein
VTAPAAPEHWACPQCRGPLTPAEQYCDSCQHVVMFNFRPVSRENMAAARAARYGPGQSDKDQRWTIVELLGQLRIFGRVDRLTVLSGIAQRPIEALIDLSQPEAEHAIVYLRAELTRKAQSQNAEVSSPDRAQ